MPENRLTKSKDKVSLIMLTGLFIVGLLFSLIFVTSVLYMFGVTVSPAHLPVAVLLSAVACFLLSGRSFKRTGVVVGAGVAIVLAAAVLGAAIPDDSWDGNSYHKMIAGFLRNGWNPLHESIYDFADHNYPLTAEFHASWLDAYPKGTEIIAACFYRVTGNIETGKLFNWLSVAAVGCVCSSYLETAARLRKWQALVCGAVFALNPVSAAQVFCFYNDGFLWQMVLICTAALLYLLLFEKGSLRPASLFLVFTTISIGFNVKFSGVIFFALPCAGLFVLWAVRELLKKDKKGCWRRIFAGVGFFAAAVACGFLVCGSNSYVMNAVRHRNPFYSIFGEGANEIILGQMPKELLDDPEWKRVAKNLLSGFGVMNETSPSGSIDQRIGGWGPLFSLLLIFSGVVLFIVWLRNLKRRPLLCRVMEVFAALGLLAVFTVPGLWWPRYFVAPFYIPVVALVVFFFIANRKEGTFVPFVAGCIAVLFAINAAPALKKNIETYRSEKNVDAEWDRMRAISERAPIKVSVRYQVIYEFYGRMFNVFDKGIGNYSFIHDPESWDDAVYHTVYQMFPISYFIPEEGVWAANDLTDYLGQVREMDGVTLLVAVRGDVSGGLTDEAAAELRALGLEIDLRDHACEAYAAVVENGKKRFEKASAKGVIWNDPDGVARVYISSSSDGASVFVNGTDYSLNGPGMNCVLLDSESGCVLDSAVFDPATGTARHG